MATFFQVLLMAAERQSQLKLGPYYVISSNVPWVEGKGKWEDGS
jgi:hypothetical protein